MNDEFKSVIQKDINQTFFNTDEFCDYHTIDGKRMRVLFDNLELSKRYPNGTKNSDGLYTDEMIIFVPIEDYGARPKIKRRLVLDGKRNYSIENVDEEDGMYIFTLEAFQV
ncbi:MAG: hypothetical protein Q4B62_05270 [Clostridiaceae bacterium]|nr:hypothetical protein [Clostridiaceae bacterium]